ncbi:hypothetical protein G6F65_023213 [Rhizopus arrhizus]|nr:hypothetical protein G6F31_017097 [Rhizopus arrhizus]KAG1242040.1 hypothetical protein G6F65_023213 [Rhizopus arrhizus]
MGLSTCRGGGRCRTGGDRRGARRRPAELHGPPTRAGPLAGPAPRALSACAADPGRRQRPETVQAERCPRHRHPSAPGGATGRLAGLGLCAACR